MKGDDNAWFIWNAKIKLTSKFPAAHNAIKHEYVLEAGEMA